MLRSFHPGQPEPPLGLSKPTAPEPAATKPAAPKPTPTSCASA
jgi:hypothetical protein